MSSSLEEILRIIDQDHSTSTCVDKPVATSVSFPLIDVLKTNPDLLKLQLYDGKILPCPEDVLRCSTLMTTGLNNFSIADDSDPFLLLVPKCTEEAMQKLFEYCAQHRNEYPVRPQTLTSRERRDMQLSDWDREFIEAMDRSMLVQLINAAYVLEIQGMV